MIINIHSIKKRSVIIGFGIITTLILLFIIQPYIPFRLTTRIFVYYEIIQYKYPGSYLSSIKTHGTSKVSMVTEYIFTSTDNIDTVIEFMENKYHGFIHLKGSRAIKEPTFIKTISVSDTLFNDIYKNIEWLEPEIEILIYPEKEKLTSIMIRENWCSMGAPDYLMWL
jgi:hypothetical protein